MYDKTKWKEKGDEEIIREGDAYLFTDGRNLRPKVISLLWHGRPVSKLLRSIDPAVVLTPHRTHRTYVPRSEPLPLP